MEYEPQQLELLKRRFGGSVNIKGIDFQILYTLYYALDLCETGSKLEKITLEGLEDIDLKPFLANNTYVQVKTSSTQWHFRDLVAPLVNFLKLYSISETPPNFELVFNFQPRESFISLFSKEQNHELIQKLYCIKEFKENQITENQLIEIISKCELKHIQKPKLVLELKTKMVNILNLQPNETDLILLAMAYQFINWSIERKTITKQDLYNTLQIFKEKQDRNKQFEAYGKGLIDRIDWHKDINSVEYYEGKKTRAGHIVLGLDIKRTKWIDKISEIFSTSNVCIIREASGQGKSTLALRYCFENWNNQHSFTIKIVESLEQAEQISSYLISMAELGLPISVLIDDVNGEKRYFIKVLENCAGYKIPFLVTCRNEDYFKYSSVSNISMGHIQPTFELPEALNIFSNLKREGKINPNTISGEWAYEKINSPKCLIEFIYLITQGQMLHERLTDQIHVMQRENNNGKIDFLRKVILADFSNSPININDLIINDLGIVNNYQQIISELTGEYIYLEEDLIKGYHWVRSAHLVEILHQNFANCAITALQIIPYINPTNIPDFLGLVSNVKGFNSELFISEFGRIRKNIDIKEYLLVLEGIFQIGEYQFFTTNKTIFDQAFSKYSGGAIHILTAYFYPTKAVNLFDTFEDNENFKDLKSISESISTEIRGIGLVKKFVEKNKLASAFNINTDFELLCHLMDWSFWVKSEIFDFSPLIEKIEIFQFDLKVIGFFSQTLYRLNEHKFFTWFTKNEKAILTTIEKKLECSIKLENNIVVMRYFKYLQQEDLHEATMKRLIVIRSLLPFCEKYQGRHVLGPAFSAYMNIAKNIEFDPSFKDIPAENLPFESDVEKNKTFKRIIEENYVVKTWYEFEACYFDLRNSTLIYSQTLIRRLKGLKHDFGSNSAHHIYEKILHSHKYMPLGMETTKEIEDLFEICTKAFNNYNNFLLMKDRFNTETNDEFAKKMIFVNFNNFLRKLSQMQLFFKEIKSLAPIYFEFGGLIEKENYTYTELRLLLRKNIPNSVEYWDISTDI